MSETLLQTLWHSDNATMTAHLLGALVAGGLIGLERSYHGRPAGFRTHTLVCLASAVLMLVTLFQGNWLPGIPLDSVRTDPTRMAQGIMTGIGFLGAGVIYKEGFSVRGLTTAGSIWMTAAVGILFGIGFYFPALLATALTLGTLSVFRWVETRMPTQTYAHHQIRFARDDVLAEGELCALLAEHGFSVANLSYRVVEDGRYFEYRMVIRTESPAAFSRLAESLRTLASVREFRISPTGD
ncbi:MgtC/SapB family protein [Azoarcus olearius]|uniref:Protein MgtC n=1 Tax=Azoarcus sp. (strain BH72) TaxID=418699 RepID=A1K7V1_AZOSB|nr:MgtC/SapB family protein [Azoarcus olearius]ANQ85452.1 putative transport ATPase [Azoarcus olearius]CAL94906.1 putative transport ATPase [Azoarcus olearius]